MDLRQRTKAFFQRGRAPLAQAGIVPGLYHYQRETGGAVTRFHLRVDSSGGGLLVANASAAARLRPSGVVIAKALLEGWPAASVAGRLTASFRGVTPSQATADVEQVRRIIAELESPGDNYPILNLTDPSFTPKATPLDGPLSADVPLAPPERLLPILDRLWELAIPHVTLIAGEHPDAAALVQAVERAEDLGLIAGVRGRGTDLLQGSLIRDLAQAGVDHVDVLYLSADAAVHDALAGSGDHANAVEALAEVRRNEVCPVAEVPLLEATLGGIDATLGSLAAAGVSNVCFWAIAAVPDGGSHQLQPFGGMLLADDLVEAARLVEESAEQSRVRFLWYPPVRFQPGAPLAAQVRRGPRCSGDTAVRVEPDGRVIPARGPYRSAGNLLSDDWSTIYRHEGFREYRRRVETDTHCPGCPGLAICAADCPRNPEGWAEREG